MINGKIIGIDARMIEMSGIGTYIQHLMGQGIYDYAFGKEEEIRKYDSDVKIISFDAPIYSINEQLRFPNREAKDAGIDIIHFPHYNVPITYRGKFVTTVHDLTHIILPEFLGSKIKYYYAKFLMNNALKRAAHIFTVSQNSKRDIIEYFGISDNKISITYNAIDNDFKVKEKEEIEYLYDKYGIPKEKKIVLYVGNLKPHKNLHTLLKAVSILDRADILLLLVGKAFKSIDLVQQEKELNISDRVIHTGMVEKEKLVDLYNLADIFVFPSLYEGFGIPPLEAMACGTPVIAADNSSIPEVCGDAAVLFNGKDDNELAEKISNTISDQELRKELIKKGMERVSCFSWNATVSEVYRRIEMV